MRFLHCADLHLGTVRFGNDCLTPDFTRSFRRMAEDAVLRRADALIVCGDLFNRSGADLLTLHEAERTLAMLRDSDIEVIAIEGEHDVWNGDAQVSWSRLLAHHGFIKLLDGPHATGGKLREWSEDTGSGSCIDIDGVRFIGLGHVGRGGMVERGHMVEAIEPAELTVAMMHADIGQPGQPGIDGLRGSELEALREKVDYLALGHVHSRYEIDGWIHNPGGLENWRPEECVREKGYFLVDASGGKVKVEAIDSVRRPGYIIPVDVSGLYAEAQVNRAIKAAVEEKDIDPSTEPIVSVDLVGRPRLDLSRYDGGMCSWIISLTGAVECLINDRTKRRSLPEHRFDLLVQARSSSSNLTPEETSDLVLRFRGGAAGDGSEEVGIRADMPEARSGDSDN